MREYTYQVLGTAEQQVPQDNDAEIWQSGKFCYVELFEGMETKPMFVRSEGIIFKFRHQKGQSPNHANQRIKMLFNLHRAKSSTYL